MASFFAELKIFRIWPKTMDYNPWFDFWSPKKVMIKLYLLKEKSNGVCFCCVAPSIVRHFDQNWDVQGSNKHCVIAQGC